MSDPKSDDCDRPTAEQKLESIGIETNNHPTEGVPHRFECPDNTELVEVHRLDHSVLVASSSKRSSFRMHIDILYDDWKDGEFAACPVDRRGVAEHEVVIDRNTLATLADAANPHATSPTMAEREAAVERAYDALGWEDEQKSA
jgi:hypothetical protein